MEVIFIDGGGRKSQYSEKTTDMSQIVEKIYHIKIYQVHTPQGGIECTSRVVIGID